MRTRDEIEKDIMIGDTQTDQALQIELLLDIRDLLQNPPIEISGEPMSDKEYHDLFNPQTKEK